MDKASNTLSKRKLHQGHFAFMRALVQGLDQRTSWERYLRLEGEHSDVRTVRRTIAWLRDEFAAAARREMRPGTARLIQLDADRLPPEKAVPTLEAFAAAQGMEDFSESEQMEAYLAAYPWVGGSGEGAARKSRRARVVARQLEAIQWLQALVAREPGPSDAVSAWLHPRLANRLGRAGITTLAQLVGHINAIGARWWAKVPGVGPVKGARILDWLRSHEDELGLCVGTHVTVPRRRWTAQGVTAVRQAATALSPFEKFVVPAGLDGRAGRFRAPSGGCQISVDDDHAAISTWLGTKREGGGEAHASATLSATQRSYRKEAERLLLWSTLERGTELSSLCAEDIEAYRTFLQAPPENWCGPRHHQRWSSSWRPLEGPLTDVALRQAMIILRSLFTYLQAQRYVTANPFARIPLPPGGPHADDGHRLLSEDEWRLLDDRLEQHATTEAARRMRRGMRWMRATGLRTAQITRTTCADLSRVDVPATDASLTPWRLTVNDRRGGRQTLPIPTALILDLSAEFAAHGFDPDVTATENRGVPILARFESRSANPAAWSSSGLYQAIKQFLKDTADALDSVSAQRFKTASAQWLVRSKSKRERVTKGSTDRAAKTPAT